MRERENYPSLKIRAATLINEHKLHPQVLFATEKNGTLQKSPAKYPKKNRRMQFKSTARHLAAAATSNTYLPALPGFGFWVAWVLHYSSIITSSTVYLQPVRRIYAGCPTTAAALLLLLLLRGTRCSYRRTSSLLSQSHPLLSTAPKHTRTFIFLDSQVQVVGTSLRAPVPPFPVGRGIHSCAGAGVDSILSERDARARSAPLFPKGTPHSTDCYLLLLRFIDTIEPFPAFLSAF